MGQDNERLQTERYIVAMEEKLRFIVAESCIWAPVNYDITWSYNGLSPTQPQSITYTNSSLLLIEPFGKKIE